MKTPGKILIIDDDDNVRRIVTKLLSKNGYEPIAAATGKEGLALAAQRQPDLVLCDLEMPQMDGYAVFARLRDDAKLAEIPVVFLTGRAEPAQVRYGMNLGADDYVTKPFAHTDLLNAIKARLQRRQVERKRAQAQMERAMRLLVGIVHDLRNPLSVIFGYTDLLKGEAGAEPGAMPRQILERMQQAMGQMQTILSEMLLLARSRMQRLPYDPGQFDLREFCEQRVADHEQHERLTFECQTGRFPIFADALRLRQALEHLLSNALKFSQGQVIVRLRAVPPRYELEVRDAGIGIPTEEQASVFEPFFRASNTGGSPGHGLGLCVAKSCLELQGGSLRFASEVNRGTSFYLDLPESPPAVRQPTAAPEERLPVTAPQSRLDRVQSIAAEAQPKEANVGVAVQPAPKPRGIIVDDDPLIRDVMRDLALKTDEVVIVGEAGSVREARLLLRQQQPEVVLLDVNLPDGSGFDLLGELKPGTAVIFVTSAEEYAVHAFDCEAADYLLKPVSSERLKKALHRVRQKLSSQLPSNPASSRGQDSFVVKTLTEKRLVRIRDIRNISAYGEYSWVYWESGKGAMLRKPLKQWQLELPRDQFIRVHRGAIINLAHMDHIEKLPAGGMRIHLRGAGEPIPVSLRLAPLLNRRLKALHPN